MDRGPKSVYPGLQNPGHQLLYHVILSYEASGFNATLYAAVERGPEQILLAGCGSCHAGYRLGWKQFSKTALQVQEVVYHEFIYISFLQARIDLSACLQTAAPAAGRGVQRFSEQMP